MHRLQASQIKGVGSNMADSNTIELATDLTIGWLSNPATRAKADDVALFLASMSATLSELSQANAPAQQIEPTSDAFAPAVSVRKSLASPDHIISMIDGKPYRTLKRHLTRHGLTPAQYRERYGLKADYPMVAPTYSDLRKAAAKKIGLGRIKAERAVSKAASAKVAKPARGAKSVAAAKAAAKAHLGG